MEKLKSILEKNNTLFFSCSFIFLLSIFLRSTIDIGSDTAFYIDLGQRISNKEKYYYNFFESNFPLSFYFYALQHSAANFFHINTIITSEIFVNILAIFSIFYANKILEKDHFFQKTKDRKNLVITAFALSFFLRINALHAGEFGTKTSFLLILLFPYISYSLRDKNSFNKKDLIWRGILMGMIPCLKPHYAIFIILTEFHNFLRNKSFKFFLEIDKLLAFAIVLLYINLMLIFTPEFFEFMVPMWSEFYSSYANKQDFLYNIEKILNHKILLFCLAGAVFIHKKTTNIDKILILFFISSSLILLLENAATIDQEAVFYSIATICLLNFSYIFFTSEQELFTKNKFIILSLFFLPFFDKTNFFPIFFNLINMWWILPLPCIVYLAKNKNIDKSQLIFFTAISIILSIISILCLIKTTPQSSCLINFIIFFIFLLFFENFYKKSLHKFSIFLIIIITTLSSYLTNLYASSVIKTITKTQSFSTPNDLTDAMNFYIKKYAPNQDESHLVLSNIIAHNYPLITYLNKKNYFKYAIPIIYDNLEWSESKKFHTIFSTKNGDRAFVFSYLMDDLIKQIKNKKIKVIFVNKDSNILYQKNKCTIDILEYYFQDVAFRNAFFENFRFENHFTSYKKNDKILSLKNQQSTRIKPSKEVIFYDFEIYTRK